MTDEEREAYLAKKAPATKRTFVGNLLTDENTQVGSDV